MKIKLNKIWFYNNILHFFDQILKIHRQIK